MAFAERITSILEKSRALYRRWWPSFFACTARPACPTCPVGHIDRTGVECLPRLSKQGEDPVHGALWNAFVFLILGLNLEHR